MDWFNGDVSVGITEAKKRNSLFVVYIRDDSEESKKMDKTWASSEVAEICKKQGLVVMRFQKDRSTKGSPNFSLPCNISDPVLVVPSVSFISGQTGVLVEATAGHVDVAPFLDRIEAAAKAAEGSSTGNSENTKVGETSSQAPTAQTESAPAPTPAPATATAPTESVQERAARLRKKMEEVHAKKEAQKKEVKFGFCAKRNFCSSSGRYM
ncbi:UBX domain-containing protein 4 [Holothuria leucospilota]|uniref:UBX domain-containing protein 4 n=1 Tax=Holothuria leucospilota TaxID=206669 RepID=A0A9Q1BZ16_HOLLE|nr:UBX domain-containing protein 4 [Holothuria leucospilota]